MHVSERYQLGASQAALEFLDVDVVGDTPVFVDPRAFSYLSSSWGKECVSLLQDFYNEVLFAVRHDDTDRGMYLLSTLGETNEAHLGLSAGSSQGSGVSRGLAEKIFEALRSSSALKSNLLHDIYETVLFVDDIGHDRISDMTINIVKSQLVNFTQQMCLKYGIPLVSGVDSGRMWDRHAHGWSAAHVELPMPDSKLILVPKGVVRKSATFDPGDYLTNFVLPYLQEVELAKSKSPLVKVRTSKSLRGQRYVTKKSILERDPKTTKQWNNAITSDNPSLLEEYRRAKSGHSEPMSHEHLAEVTGTPPVDWDALLGNVLAIPAGRRHADDYHRAVQHLLTALLYPALDMPVREFETHEGRKRIDIAFTNVAERGFFRWLDDHGGVPAGTVIVECKNYTSKLSNPEFDQLTGRFSPRRGKFGLLCYRGFEDQKAVVVKRCRDAALDDRGYVLALDDDDLGALVAARKAGDGVLFSHLMQRFQELI